MSDEARLALAYADPVQNRMIICMEAAWPSMRAQESAFASIPDGDKGSPWIVDFHDEDGTITKDKCISAETAEEIAGISTVDLIARGNEREDALTAMLRSRRAAS